MFIDTKHDVHILHRLSHSTLQKIVDGRGDEEFVAIFLHMNQCLVGIDHLFEVDGIVADMRESRMAVEVFIRFFHILQRSWCTHHSGAEDASGKVSAVGDKVYIGIKIALHLFQRLSDFGNMLMLERFVDAEVVGTP